uniref:Uncharacterized protein n=1 Tax=Geospiza parvula TaxID=87175 RepID=A0A8C3MUE5_GEOPR
STAQECGSVWARHSAHLHLGTGAPGADKHVCVSVCACVQGTVCVSVRLQGALCVCVCAGGCPCVCVCLCVCSALSVCLAMSVCLSLSVCARRALSVCLAMSVCLTGVQPAPVPSSLHTWKSLQCFIFSNLYLPFLKSITKSN